MSVNFSIRRDGRLVPDLGYESSWYAYEERAVRQFISLEHLLFQYKMDSANGEHLKHLVVMFYLADEEERWKVIQRYSNTMMNLLKNSPSVWHVDNLFSEEQISYMRITA